MTKYHLHPVLTDDGLIDMFIIGPDGIPVARINEPTQTGEEAEILARAWIAEQEPEEEVEDDYQQYSILGPLYKLWDFLHRLRAGASALHVSERHD